jgi:hypothetical protein
MNDLDKLIARCNEMDITEQINWFGDASMPYRAKMELEEYKRYSDIVMCAYCGHESSKSDKMAIIEHTMNCDKRPELKLLEKSFEIEDKLYARIIHLTEHAYAPETCGICKEIEEVLSIYHEVEEKE